MSYWSDDILVKYAQPNISEADPDINMPYVFMMGEKMAANWAKKQRCSSSLLYYSQA